MKSSILDTFGNPIEYQPKFKSQTREELAVKIHSLFIISDQEEYINRLTYHFLKENNNIKNNQLQFSSKDTKFQDFCLSYAAQRIINSALDEDLASAYQMLLECTNSPNMNNLQSESNDITYEDIDTISKNIEQAPELQIALGVCNIQSEITGFFNGNNGKQITSYQANRLQEKFDDITDFLDDEQKAAGYYNLSIVYRALLAEKDNYDPSTNDDEKDCLRKVLEYSSDYKRINYCANRLDASKLHNSKIILAYKRALNHTEAANDLRKINLGIAETYLKDFKSIGGFKPDEKEQRKLQNAEFYLNQALNFSDNPEKLSLLKRIATLHLKLRDFKKWRETSTTIALKYMKGEERCQMLMDIAAKSENYQTMYLERALLEADKSRLINKNKKTEIIQQIALYLEPIYTMQQKPELLKKLQDVLQKYEKPKQSNNPLHKYQGRKLTR